jgi:hypothetical protein
MKHNKRLLLGILSGAILGIFCIFGAGTRLGFSGNELFLFSTWFNRVLLGLMIGLAPKLYDFKYVVYRGLILGLVVSSSLFFATEFFDIMGFFAGIIYGVIIEWILFKFEK